MGGGKPLDNPLSDLIIHGMHPFPPDMEEMLFQIDILGHKRGRWPLGENWPYSPHEFDWEKGIDLDSGRQLLSQLIFLLESGREDEVLVNPETGKPFVESKL